MHPRQIGETSNPVEPNLTQRIGAPPAIALRVGPYPAGRRTGRLAAMSETYALSGIGIWSAMLRYGDPSEVAEIAAEMEGLGYSALWIPDVGGDVWTPLTNLLAATSSVTVATGILNIWMHSAEETAAQHAALAARHAHRFLCGIGVSHRPFVDRVNEPGTYQ